MARYGFDSYLLDTDARVLKHQGEPVVTTPKVLETLRVLVQNRGRVMEKDELLRTLWPDTAVEEANLTQNISTLRKILGDDAKNHRFIATIPGRGYSFVASVNEVPAENDQILTEQQPSPRWWSQHRHRRYIGISVVIVLSGTVLYFTYPNKRHLPEPQISRFTSFPGVETMPAFSPDGKQLAYVRAEHDPISLYFPRKQVGQANIYTKLIGAASELRLTSHAGADYYPAWSPDGQYIAFYREELGASGCYLVSALGGHERRITRDEASSAGIAWFSDGRRLVVSHAPDGFQPSPLLRSHWIRASSARSPHRRPEAWVTFPRQFRTTGKHWHSFV
jgi:DNA-binding winged helix-turn-helix (wHTH) protein